MSKKTKFIFVTGGVVSSLGKGIAAASIAALLENRGLKLSMQKLDPYINVDPGTMSPFQHGEVFVTEDGSETDLDLGHYERFINAKMTKVNNMTSGKIYDLVIQKERRGEYLGRTVQVIPHITDEIKAHIFKAAQNLDLLVVEIGGTVGDIESLPFLEAIRQFKADAGKENVLYVHLTLVPFIQAADELKTKPTQHSVQKLREIGIQPDVLLCRTDRDLSRDIKNKIALFCNIDPDCVMTAKDVSSIYKVPLCLHDEGLDEKIAELLNIWTRKPDLKKWKQLSEKISNASQKVSIAVVGKYVELTDAYKSLNEALYHAGFALDNQVNLHFVDSEDLENSNTNLEEIFAKDHGILVPGGFGDRGVKGKLAAIEFARKNKIPFFGICLGMQLAVVEYARNVAGLSEAHSTEFHPKTKDPVIALMEEQKAIVNKGATMRLGHYACELNKKTLAYECYGEKEILERHRHRYEFNNDYKSALEKAGLVFSGLSPNAQLVEMVELPEHPWFLACQFHPEFQSYPFKPHPLFFHFVKASVTFAKTSDWSSQKKNKQTNADSSSNSEQKSLFGS